MTPPAPPPAGRDGNRRGLPRCARNLLDWEAATVREWTRGGITYRTGAAWTRAGLSFHATKAHRADDWDPHRHPRDARGRFVHKNAEVKLFGGGLGQIVGFDDRSGRFWVRRDSDGQTVKVLPAHITTTGRTRGQQPEAAVPVHAAPASPAAATPAQPATLRPDLTTSYRNTINGYDFDAPDSGHPETLRDAAAAVREKRPLTADQAQALADALRAQKAKETPARGRVLDRITTRMDTVSAALTGIAPAHVPDRHGVLKAHPGEVVEGDTIALPGRGGTADIRKVVASQEFYGQYKMQLEDQDGNREERLVHPATDVYLLPDAPDPVPVPPREGGREHLTPDRLRPGDFIALDDGTDAEVESVSSWTPGHFKVKTKRGTTGGTLELLRGDGSGYPSVTRTKRGPGSADQPWDSVLPDDDPTTVKADDLRVGDRITFNFHRRGDVPGTILGIETDRKSPALRRIEFREDTGVTTKIPFDSTEDVTRLARGGAGAAARIEAEKAAAKRHMLTVQIRDEMEQTDRGSQRRAVQVAQGRLDALQSSMPVASRDTVAIQVAEALQRQIGNVEQGKLDYESTYSANKVAMLLAPDADVEEVKALTKQLVPLFRDAAVRGRKRAMERVLETLDNTPEARHGGADFQGMRDALDPVRDRPVAGDFGSAAEFLAKIGPGLKIGGGDGDVVDAKVPSLPEGTSLKDRMQAYRDAIGERFGSKTARVQTFDEIRLADLEAGRAPQPKEVTQIIPDRAGDDGPGETAMTHLAILRAAGKDLDAELQRRINADVAKIESLGDGSLAEKKRLEKLADQAKTNMSADRMEGQNAFARQHGFASFQALVTAMDDSGPHSGEYTRLSRLLTYAVREGRRRADIQFAEVVRINQEIASLKVAGEATKAKRAAIQRKHTLALLGEVRDTGVGGVKMKYLGPRGGAKGDSDPLVKAMRWAEAGYPTDWLDALSKKKTFKLKKVDRGYYQGYSSTIALSGDSPEVEGAVPSSRVADHELGHAMEEFIPGLVAAEEALLWDRTSTGPIGSRTREPLTRIYRGEDGWKDKFPAHYTGKTYGSRFFEVFTTAKESLTSGSSYLDDDLRQWLLGAMATL